MAYPVSIEGFEGRKVEVEVSFWSGAKLMVDGVRAPKGSRRGEMLLTRGDGRHSVAVWKPVALGFDVPQLVVDGQTVRLVEPLRWHQWVWSALPIVLIFVGGAMGAVFGLIALSFNAGLFRSNLNPAMKYVATGAVSAAAVALYLIGAMLLNSMIGA